MKNNYIPANYQVITRMVIIDGPQRLAACQESGGEE